MSAFDRNLRDEIFVATTDIPEDNVIAALLNYGVFFHYSELFAVIAVCSCTEIEIKVKLETASMQKVAPTYIWDIVFPDFSLDLID